MIDTSDMECYGVDVIAGIDQNWQKNVVSVAKC